MATKLKNLKIRKVDFVDEGANPDADIKMKKRKEKKQTVENVDKKKTESVLKKLFGFIGKAAGMNQEEIDSAVDEIQKDASMSFNEKINEFNQRKIMDEIWGTCYALQSSLCSILNDEELNPVGAAAAMQESLGEFTALVQGAISFWTNGKTMNIVQKKSEVSENELEIMKFTKKRLEEICKNVAFEEHAKMNEKENQKGDRKEMNIDKSKLTDAERAFLESIEKRYGTEGKTCITNEEAAGIEQATVLNNTNHTIDLPAIAKSAVQPANETILTSQTNPQDEIYKGLHPAVVAELEGLRKFREDAEARELAEVAKKYAIIGKKEEELVPTLKCLKAAGGTAYQDMIAVLDQAVETVEKSGAFSEIGRAGHNNSENSAEAKIAGIAKGYMEKDASLSYHWAVAKAWEENPDLLAEYDEQEGF